MTGCAHDGNTIPVIAPMDAEGRKVPFDTKALYDSKGKEHGVLGFNFSTLDGPSWSVWLDDRYDGDDFSFTSTPLDSMYVDKSRAILKNFIADVRASAYDLETDADLNKFLRDTADLIERTLGDSE